MYIVSYMNNVRSGDYIRLKVIGVILELCPPQCIYLNFQDFLEHSLNECKSE